MLSLFGRCSSTRMNGCRVWSVLANRQVILDVWNPVSCRSVGQEIGAPRSVNHNHRCDDQARQAEQAPR